MRNRERGVHEGIHDVNMTPLIDVSLVLVVILMVATPLAFQSSIALRNAAASGHRAREAARAGRVELEVLADGQVRVDRVTVPRAELAAALGPRLQGAPVPLVVVRCEDGASHGQFVEVIDEARTLGAAQIAVDGR